HGDGNFVRSEDERSFYTVNIYLNSTHGGPTRFLQRGGNGVSLHEVQPKPGLALIFRHPIYHDGAPLKSGLKYIVRSDIVYKRRPSDPEEAARQQEEREAEALKAYTMATELEDSNQHQKAVAWYKKAFSLWAELDGSR